MEEKFDNCLITYYNRNVHSPENYSQFDCSNRSIFEFIGELNVLLERKQEFRVSDKAKDGQRWRENWTNISTRRIGYNRIDR